MRGLCIYVGISYRAPERRLRVHLEDVDAVEVLGGLDLVRVRVRVEGLGLERVGQGARAEGYGRGFTRRLAMNSSPRRSAMRGS